MFITIIIIIMVQCKYKYATYILKINKFHEKYGCFKRRYTLYKFNKKT